MKRLCIVLACSLGLISCGEQEIDNPAPTTYELNQNYPNPFTDTTVIEYGVPDLRPSAGPWVRMVVYDRFNIEQVVLINRGDFPAGRFKVTWDGIGLNGVTVPSGLYYIELQQGTTASNFTEDFSVVDRIVAVKK
jgi:hypothetical protein